MASGDVERKLTTILAADVVGYSRLMADDEEATLETLRDYRQVIDGLIQKHRGRIFNTAGDAALAEFGSAVETVRCAISIQEELRARNSELPESRQMWFRIGINVGDVMIDGQDLFGDGVNVAARLEGLAEKGGICISGSAFEHVKNKLSVAFRDIGLQSVKNIPEPVSAYQLVPGQVAVGKQHGPNFFATSPGRFAIVAVALAAVVGVAIIGGLTPDEFAAEHPFDGHWKVTVTSLSGCLSNEDRSFSLNVEDGKIDEAHQQFPKSGEIGRDGRFTITATDRTGNVLNTQTGTVADDAGEGRFQGTKPGCTGLVRLDRLP